MARFNTRATKARTTSPVTTTGRTLRTGEGGHGHERDARSELFLLAVANFVSENTFYESGADRDNRFATLVRQLAVTDPEWTAGLLRWLRGEGNLRTAAVVGAAEYVHARLAAGVTEGPSNRGVVDSVLQRPDEPGELLAYWTATHGRNVPKPVKRGVADAVRRLYHAKSLLKYDTSAKGYRFGDILNLVHAAPDPAKPWQGELFRYALDRRHHPETAVVPGSDQVLRAHRELMELPVERRRAVVTSDGGAERLAAAGMTWEALAGWLQGPMDKDAWEAVIPSMGAMALLRNLRNFDEAGVCDEVAARVAARISDPEQVARSRQFPFRYLAAYRHAPSLRWSYPLERALGHSLANVPALPGRTLVLVDRSGSMWSRLSERSQLNRADAAAIFGTALALRAEDADLVEFGTTSRRLAFDQGESVLRILERFGDLGGTDTVSAIRSHYRGQDRVLIVTDEQYAYSSHGDPTGQVPADIPVYTWNLAGYRAGHGPSGTANRHTFGGLSDAAFRMVPLLERARNADWPWHV
ncbi:TROVE domain-containing protein [Streptomyces acidiscabies]|uniref:TROVE domain-containing protein n=1 Tax=Streptomyces acidiscabies TaxID=42234 RepID=A0AAP6B635_9ACTN|nr:TROVE domain-containing protein [Streptomyces acidiscabies]MBP5940395.1 TROVE domain-containing protein [Streptomyces sp. LBUM 1476]MBZ3911634.1 TROVE domain-containing protein [Streptomyces acidiscabies]MDX2958859.1 TROVE domain-containing protein [Streptomyces acidiscabies]MDX3018296.1 TROVE domain-containing protein [Streptomyces acidiscabies]MDX3791694.1 TROVE domain-containing protein [Streptomyces acidiscabies]